MTSTGFIRPMVDILEEEAAKQGYKPDASVAGDEVVHGARPAPHMVYKNLDLMGIHTIQSVVKVDDTVSGIGEALNAGCWGVGVVRYSNYMDVNTPEQGASLSAAEIDRRMAITRDILEKAGAHYVIDSLADIEPVIEDINARLARGEKALRGHFLHTRACGALHGRTCYREVSKGASAWRNPQRLRRTRKVKQIPPPRAPLGRAGMTTRRPGHCLNATPPCSCTRPSRHRVSRR